MPTFRPSKSSREILILTIDFLPSKLGSFFAKFEQKQYFFPLHCKLQKMLIVVKPCERLRNARIFSSYGWRLKCAETHATLHEANLGLYFLLCCSDRSICKCRITCTYVLLFASQSWQNFGSSVSSSDLRLVLNHPYKSGFVKIEVMAAQWQNPMIR